MVHQVNKCKDVTPDQWFQHSSEITDYFDDLVKTSNTSAIDASKVYLRQILQSETIDVLEAYFVNPVYSPRTHSTRLDQFDVSNILDRIYASLQDISVNSKSRGMQIGILGIPDEFDITTLGYKIEPESSLYVLSPFGLLNAAQANASIEIRQFDRLFPDWTLFADALSTVTGGDIFMKLFIAGGDRSVNKWHRDTSDVMVIMLSGSKRFEIGTFESIDDKPVNEVDCVLRAGDVIVMPRSRLHNATPTGELSALLSIGIMRFADWAYRGVKPTHLGIYNIKSPGQYRLALKSHLPIKVIALNLHSKIRTRIPGGIGLTATSEDIITFVAAGNTFSASISSFELLCHIHAQPGLTVANLATLFDISKTQLMKMLYAFSDLALITTV